MPLSVLLTEPEPKTVLVNKESRLFITADLSIVTIFSQRLFLLARIGQLYYYSFDAYVN